MRCFWQSNVIEKARKIYVFYIVPNSEGIKTDKE